MGRDREAQQANIDRRGRDGGGRYGVARGSGVLGLVLRGPRRAKRVACRAGNNADRVRRPVEASKAEPDGLAAAAATSRAGL